MLRGIVWKFTAKSENDLRFIYGKYRKTGKRSFGTITINHARSLCLQYLIQFIGQRRCFKYSRGEF